MAGKANNVSSVSASACHIGGPIGVNPGELTLAYGNTPRFLEIFFRNGHQLVVANFSYFFRKIVLVIIYVINLCYLLQDIITSINNHRKVVVFPKLTEV